MCAVFIRALKVISHDYEVNIMDYGPSLDVCINLPEKLNVNVTFHGVDETYFGLMDFIAIQEPWSINKIRKLDVRKKVFETVEPGIVLHKAAEARTSEILCKNDVSIEATRPLIRIVV